MEPILELKYALNTLWFVLAGGLSDVDGCGFFDAPSRAGSNKEHYRNFNEERRSVLHCMHYVPAFGLQPHVRGRKLFHRQRLPVVGYRW